MSEAGKEQSGTSLASVQEVPELIGKELSEDDMRQEFRSLQRFGRIVHLTWSGSLILAIAWVMVKVLRPDYTFTWADFAHDWFAIFLTQSVPAETFEVRRKNGEFRAYLDGREVASGSVMSAGPVGHA